MDLGESHPLARRRRLRLADLAGGVSYRPLAEGDQMAVRNGMAMAPARATWRETLVEIRGVRPLPRNAN